MYPNTNSPMDSVCTYVSMAPQWDTNIRLLIRSSRPGRLP